MFFVLYCPVVCGCFDSVRSTPFCLFFCLFFPTRFCLGFRSVIAKFFVAVLTQFVRLFLFVCFLVCFVCFDSFLFCFSFCVAFCDERGKVEGRSKTGRAGEGSGGGEGSLHHMCTLFYRYLALHAVADGILRYTLKQMLSCVTRLVQMASCVTR